MVSTSQMVQNLLKIILSLMAFEIINILNLCQKAAIALAVEDQGHKRIGFKALPKYTHVKSERSKTFFT